MTPTVDKQSSLPDPAPNGGDEDTGLAWPRTWRALYIFVGIVFVGWVTILYALTRTFS